MESFLVLGLGLGIGHDAGPGVEVNFAPLDHEGADGDVETAFAVEPEHSDGSSV